MAHNPVSNGLYALQPAKRCRYCNEWATIDRMLVGIGGRRVLLTCGHNVSQDIWNQLKTYKELELEPEFHEDV